ncbi:MAG: glutaredoxin 3 [Deltaproteobacteria bacterium]|nr:glutaredoxin 3 [Deltaproteobacteria bacterium]
MATIEVYSKSWCPFCRMAKRLLEEKGQEFVEFDVELDPAKYDEMLERSQGRWTVPEIFIDGELIGGFDELRALDASGRLDEMLGS